MVKWKRRVKTVCEVLVVFRRSLIQQSKEFFCNSTLHGMRYFGESHRSSGEKFMWFCITTMGAISALVIIMSLWEKFQTNPTITGLETDFHLPDMVFPTTVVCPEIPFDHDKSYDVALNYLTENDSTLASMSSPFLELLTTMSYANIGEAHTLSQSVPADRILPDLRYWTFKVHIECKDTLLECKYRDEQINCCSHFELVYTEYGICYAFNSRFKSLPHADVKTGPPHDLYETDKKWGLYILPNVTAKVFLFSYEEYFGSDFKPQIEWSDGQFTQIWISKKHTYTADNARQLTIGQRKCIFHDEVKLKYFPGDYTFSSCMKECRIKKALLLCNCNPSFNTPVASIRMCGIDDLICLFQNRENITNIADCLYCQLSCSKSVFNIEKMIKIFENAETPGVSIEFLNWPIVRYKREVLFGWVDLLVSFGGIAGLFLGFSILSAIEIIYYFTLRACCVVYKHKQELQEIEESIKHKPPPPIDLSLRLRTKSRKKEKSKDTHTTRTRVKSQDRVRRKSVAVNAWQYEYLP